MRSGVKAFALTAEGSPGAESELLGPQQIRPRLANVNLGVIGPPLKTTK